MIPQHLLDRQLQLEKEAHEASYTRLQERIRHCVDKKQSDQLLEGHLILKHSIEAVTKKITEFFDASLRGNSTARKIREMLALDYYKQPADLAYVLIATTVRQVSSETHIKQTQLIKTLNTAVYEAIQVKRFDEEKEVASAYIEAVFKKRSKAYREKYKLKFISSIRQRQGEHLQPASLTSLGIQTGGYLLDFLIKSGINIIKVNNVKTKAATVSYTNDCLKLVLSSRELLLEAYQKYPIFIVPPKNWESFYGTGGYYNSKLYKTTLIKTYNSKKLLNEYLQRTDNKIIYSVLNSIQQTAWRINARVFEVFECIFQNNLIDPASSRKMPYLLGKIPYNGFLDPHDIVRKEDYGEIIQSGEEKGLFVDKKNFKQYKRDFITQENLFLSLRGKAIMANLIYHEAKKYSQEEKFYFSYNYDFRGRVYPLQQHLQPQSSGNYKALLEFAEGCSITTKEQERWFLIHGANCRGYDKLNYNERVEAILTHSQEFSLIADDPIKNADLWKDADEPLLYLAWVFEYVEYLRDPENFVSHIPIALDATCSGIQIYSGLLRDKEGARSVNVIGNKRSDIYQEVADKVNKYLNDGEYPKLHQYQQADGVIKEASFVATANSLKGKVTRALTKRNTMTQPYSVTSRGMYEQLKDTLYELEHENNKFWVGDTWLAAKLLTILNERAIQETVKAASVGQNFLKEVTREVVAQGKWVFYTTVGTRFPVVQKIQKTRGIRVDTPRGRLWIRKSTNEVCRVRMENGIAPNFVHSLDAALLSLTVKKLKERGCNSYHLIHDSYGVLIKDVEALNVTVRESFIEIFKANPLKDFIEQIQPQLVHKIKEVMIDDLDLEEVRKADYIFS